MCVGASMGGDTSQGLSLHEQAENGAGRKARWIPVRRGGVVGDRNECPTHTQSAGADLFDDLRRGGSGREKHAHEGDRRAGSTQQTHHESSLA